MDETVSIESYGRRRFSLDSISLRLFDGIIYKLFTIKIPKSNDIGQMNGVPETKEKGYDAIPAEGKASRSFAIP